MLQSYWIWCYKFASKSRIWSIRNMTGKLTDLLSVYQRPYKQTLTYLLGTFLTDLLITFRFYRFTRYITSRFTSNSRFYRFTRDIKTLLNKVPPVPRVFKCPIAWVTECPSALSTSWVPECPSSAQVPFVCPISLWVPFN